MSRKLAPTICLFLLSAVLLALPGEILRGWRLSLHSLYVEAGESARAAAGSASPAPAETPAEQVALLRERIIQKDAEIADLRLKLRSLLDVRERFPTLRILDATVVYRAGPRADSLTANRGFRDGARPGDAVLRGTALVGTIARIGRRAADVRLISNPESLIPARTAPPSDGPASRREGIREVCAVVGLSRGRAKVVFYTPDIRADAGTPILTSGLLGQLPPDLPIGELADTPSEGAKPGTREAPLRLARPLTNLDALILVHRAGQPD